MVKIIEDLSNYSDEGHDEPPVLVGSTTAVKILDHFDVAGGDDQPLSVRVYNSGPTAVWVKSQPAPTDNLKQGVPVGPGERLLVSGLDAAYIGEVSAIRDYGPAYNVYVSWL